jgi:predicted DNA-binding transcriptional regulator AlpA
MQHTTQAKPPRCRRTTQPLQALYVPNALLRGETVLAVTGMSASGLTRARLSKAAPFPPPIAGVDSRPRWRAAEVLAWLDRQGQATGKQVETTTAAPGAAEGLHP